MEASGRLWLSEPLDDSTGGSQGSDRYRGQPEHILRGIWDSIDLLAPRAGNDISLTENVEADRVRLVFAGSHRIMGASRVMPSSATRASRMIKLKGAVHSRLGDIAVPAGDEGVIIEPMDLLQVELADTNAVSDGRERLLRYRVSAATGAPVRQRRTGTTNLPAEFALGQNQPNPFGDDTVIRFALPVRSQVALEIFDVHGRRVRSLARGAWQAGYHTLSWDGRDGEGQRVGAGIYLYRMTAGSFTKSRKLVVLP